MGCALFVLMLFLLLTAQPPPLYNNPYLEGKDVVLSGRLSQIRIKTAQEKLQLILDDVLISGSIGPNEEKLNNYSGSMDGVICYCDKDAMSYSVEALKLGSRVRVKGTFYNLKEASNPGQFDMAAYYRSRGVCGSLARAVVTDVSKDHDVISQALFNLRLKMADAFDEYLDDVTAGILRAMILGDKDYLDEDIKLLFENAGCAHLLVISGTHIGIVGVGIYRALKRLTGSVYISCGLGGALTLGYCNMTGRGISSQRAVIMFLICILGDCLGRTYDLITALSLSALFCLCQNPFMIFDPAFLLSFSALAGIGLLGPYMNGIFEENKILKTAGMSISVSAFTLAPTLYFFCKYPVYSLILNLMLLPFSGMLIFSGMSLALCSLLPFSGGICRVAAFMCELFTGGYVTVCRFFVSQKGSVFVTGQPHLTEIFIYYLILGVLMAVFKKVYFMMEDEGEGKKKKVFYGMLFPGLILALMAVFILWPRQRGGFNFVMLDVGQGDGLVAYTKDACIISDMGSSDESEVGKYVGLPALKALGIRKVNAILVSHTDADHINGLYAVMEGAKNEGIGLDALVMTDNSLLDEAGKSLRLAALKEGIKVYRAGEGDEMSFGDMHLKVLWPKKGSRGEANEMSMVLGLYCEGTSVLLSGDVEGAGEEYLAKSLKGERFFIYKAAHHGSKNSSRQEIMDEISPRLTMISCGENNRYGHPHEEAIKRIEGTGSLIYVTAGAGAIMVHCGEGKARVETYSEKINQI